MKKLKDIKLIVLDVDGTLTDGGIYFDNSGNEFKKFNIKDGAGIVLAQKVGYDFLILTGRMSSCVQRRCADLKIRYVEQGVTNKMEFLSNFMKMHNLKSENVAYIGDDLIDMGPMQIVGVRACPQDAVEELKCCCDYVLPYKGGEGAVRYFLEILLKENQLWNDALSRLYNLQQVENYKIN
ncbi:KdsC family phosphatase [Phocaeicola barnesiae]|uniref:HAD-IIIA family hydrolase n=1 Tax=Phocaeicola barnesiae TaxID=376804 RepID=A0AAW5N2G5_9BACT|nr:HAD-IIIA family hydrolase [Phocaeicola barnesiae]MCR8872920.1 HAD-IIIA family hydrolase [Phocaeicola barnesiae]